MGIVERIAQLFRQHGHVACEGQCREAMTALEHALQRGPMDDTGLAAFEAMPFWQQAVMLRRWDDLAKAAGRQTPPIEWYLPMLDGLCRRDAQPVKARIGAADVA